MRASVNSEHQVRQAMDVFTLFSMQFEERYNNNNNCCQKNEYIHFELMFPEHNFSSIASSCLDFARCWSLSSPRLRLICRFVDGGVRT
jgi:hypothetical protein